MTTAGTGVAPGLKWCKDHIMHTESVLGHGLGLVGLLLLCIVSEGGGRREEGMEEGRVLSDVTEYCLIVNYSE